MVDLRRMCRARERYLIVDETVLLDQMNGIAEWEYTVDARIPRNYG